MAEQNLKATLERIGLKQSELARLLDVSPRTVSLWATGEVAIPGPVAAYLRLMLQLPPALRAGELNRLEGRHRMFDEGIYSLEYAGEDRGSRDGGTGLAVLRNGSILGSDRDGALFSGSYEFDPVRQKNQVHLRLRVPPDGTLVTGFAAGPEGALLDIVGAFDRAEPETRTTIDVAGAPVEVKLTYVGPLPN